MRDDPIAWVADAWIAGICAKRDTFTLFHEVQELLCSSGFVVFTVGDQARGADVEMRHEFACSACVFAGNDIDGLEGFDASCAEIRQIAYWCGDDVEHDITMKSRLPSRKLKVGGDKTMAGAVDYETGVRGRG